MNDINTIIDALHLDEFYSWSKRDSVNREFRKDFNKLHTINDRDTKVFGPLSESVLCKMLKMFYNERYDGQFIVEHTNDTASKFSNYDSLADSTIGDVVVHSNTRQTYCIDLKATNENEVGSITWPSPLNFGSDSLNDYNRQRLLNIYHYNHSKTLDNHIYLLASSNFETMIAVKAITVFNNWDKMKRYVLKPDAFITFLDNRRGYLNFSKNNTIEDRKEFPGIQSTLIKNVDWRIL